MPIAVDVKDLTFRYPEADGLALEDVTWKIPEGAYALVAGPSGSGKSTLLRCLNGLVPHFTGGQFGGRAVVAGHDTRHFGPRVLSRLVGFVFQDPEAQFVTGRVDDEIAFGMEQLGVLPATMRKRVEEMLDLLGIASLRARDVATLSGGERQRVAIAAALAVQPRLLALDEPTSQLDPIGAEEVLAALARLNDDLGLTVALVEHRLERVVAQADQIRILGAAGSAVAEGEPRSVLISAEAELLPPLITLGRALGWTPLPLSIKDGRRAVARNAAAGRAPTPPPADPGPASGRPIVRLHRVTAGFDGSAVLRDLDFELRPGEIVTVMGRNGAGKTTLLRAIVGFHRPERGRVEVDGGDIANVHPAEVAAIVGYVPQQPAAMLFAETVRDELAFTLANHGGRGPDPVDLLERLGLTHLAERHPRDLSGGERERVAIAAILAGGPRVLLLDEPTRGMDATRKRELAVLLRQLARDGVAVVLATHDVELAAAVASRVVMLGDGRVVADGGPRAVLSGSMGFSTQTNKLYGDGFLTPEDVLRGFGWQPERALRHSTGLRGEVPIDSG